MNTKESLSVRPAPEQGAAAVSNRDDYDSERMIQLACLGGAFQWPGPASEYAGALLGESSELS